MQPTITNGWVQDIRFPTSLSLDGSDAMNKDPDYSAAYVILETDILGMESHGFTFPLAAAMKFAASPLNLLTLT